MTSLKHIFHILIPESKVSDDQAVRYFSSLYLKTMGICKAGDYGAISYQATLHLI